ncbi:hypothetical protein BH09MYX1_BH09MYX1_07010 [soil metagenome]
MSASSFSLAPLLVHSEQVPPGARAALRNAFAAAPEAREELLLHAARAFAQETDLECYDIRELVGLTGEGSCG